MVTGGLSTLVSFSIFNFLVHGLYLTSRPVAVYPASAGARDRQPGRHGGQLPPEPLLDVPPPAAGARRRRPHGVLPDQRRHPAAVGRDAVVQPARPGPDRPAGRQPLRQRRRRADRAGRAVLPVPHVRLPEAGDRRRGRAPPADGPPPPTSRSRSTRGPSAAPTGRSRRGRARPTRSRSSGRLSPTTLWWSPSIPVTNAPPSPSTVNAPATWSGSPVATYAAISASVTSAKCTTVDAVASRPSAGAGVAQAVTGVKHAGAAAHRLPATYGVVGVVGLAERRAVEVEHGVAAEHQRPRSTRPSTSPTSRPRRRT